MKPAKEGTLTILRACHANRVSRVVICSSIAAVQAMATADKPANLTYNESHWGNENRPEGMGPYIKSKVVAEKAAWNF